MSIKIEDTGGYLCKAKRLAIGYAALIEAREAQLMALARHGGGASLTGAKGSTVEKYPWA